MRCAVALPICLVAGLLLASGARADGYDSVSAEAPAAQVPSGGGLGVGISIGTTGVGGELSVRPFGNFVLRAAGTWFALDYYHSVDDLTFNLKADLVSAGATIDWHPFANGFRLSAGARYHGADFTGAAVAGGGGTFEINGNTYDIAVTGPVDATSKWSSSIAPYFGIGYDSTHFSDSRWALAFDIGVLYTGRPSAVITVLHPNSYPTLQADLADVQKDLDDYAKYGRFWPVATLTLKYRF